MPLILKLQLSGLLLGRVRTILSLFSIKSESYSELYKKVYALNKNINKKDIYVEIIEKKKYFQFFLSYFCLQKNEIRRKSQ